MKYQVLQNGITADTKGYPEITLECWNNSKFDTKREAEIYAYIWAYPVSVEEAIEIAPEMEINKEYDYSMGGYVSMSIIEVDQNV